MDWDEVVDAARATGWTAYVGTADADGRPHVSVVAPGFTPGSVWFATRTTSKKYRNLTENPEVAFHWPVAGAGPGELAAWGRATLHSGPEERRRIWDAGIMGYDLAGFFDSPDNETLGFVQVAVSRARLLGPGFVSTVWTPGA